MWRCGGLHIWQTDVSVISHPFFFLFLAFPLVTDLSCGSLVGRFLGTCRGPMWRSPLSPHCSNGLPPSDQRNLLGSMMVVIRGAERQSLNLRVSPDIKHGVEAYAEANGISINAAASVLLTQALKSLPREKKR